MPYLANKNNLERKLPQVKPHRFPDSSLLSVSIEIFFIYFGKFKQLLLRLPKASISQSSIFIIIILSTEGGGEGAGGCTASQA